MVPVKDGVWGGHGTRWICDAIDSSRVGNELARELKFVMNRAIVFWGKENVTKCQIINAAIKIDTVVSDCQNCCS